MYLCPNFYEMKTNVFRLTFIDVIRAFAICMMLQGHFIDGLLGNEYRDTSNIFFSVWLYFRGITAPVFFTVSGFIFMYLLAKERDPYKTGWGHVRVRKGIKRGITLIIVAYLLRTNLNNLLFSDYIDMNVRMVDVLHCIGFSLLFLITIYLFSYQKKKWLMPTILLATTLILFIFAPVYNELNYSYLPIFLANYFTQANGSVFTIFPWFGYASFGAFVGVLFNLFKDKKHIYTYSVGILVVLGGLLIYGTSPLFATIYQNTELQLAKLLSAENYLFQRLGNVLWVFTFFILLRNVITSKRIQTIGQNTLSIYIIHYIILYGSFTGIGLYRFFNHQLTPIEAIIGALIFVIITLVLSFLYNKRKPFIDEVLDIIQTKAKILFIEIYHIFGLIVHKVRNFISILFNKVNN